MYLGSVRFFKHVIYLLLMVFLLMSVISIFTLGNQFIHKAFAKTVTEDTAKQSPNPVLPQEAEAEPEPEPLKLEYQQKYPELQHEMPVKLSSEQKTAYLTFDDGPSKRTVEILDILKDRNIKATFFVVTNNCDPEIIKRIVAEGHTLGIHTHSHQYNQIYQSVEAYLDDFYTAYYTIYQITGVQPRIFRFPGGSINSYNREIYQELIAEMLRRGFVYYDWNLSTLDTAPKMNASKIVSSLKTNYKKQDRLFILAHDSAYKSETVKALPKIIDFFLDEGYRFARIENAEPVFFAYHNR